MKTESTVRIESGDIVRIVIASNGTLVIEAAGKDLYREKSNVAIESEHLPKLRQALEQYDKEQYRREKCEEHALEDKEAEAMEAQEALS